MFAFALLAHFSTKTMGLWVDSAVFLNVTLQETAKQMPLINLGCVWFEGQARVVVGIPNHLARDSPFLCLVGWVRLTRLLFGLKDRTWLRIALECLV